MHVIIDGDIICYRAGFACENEEQVIALWQTDEMIRRIIAETNSSTYSIWLTGGDNFRNEINPEYKANRKEAKRPKWLQQIREHLVVNWGAKVTDGIEADDAMGIEQALRRKEAGL